MKLSILTSTTHRIPGRIFLDDTEEAAFIIEADVTYEIIPRSEEGPEEAQLREISITILDPSNEVSGPYDLNATVKKMVRAFVNAKL